MSTHDAFKIVDSDDSLLAIVWWDGRTIRSTDAEFLSKLKREQIGHRTFGDGKTFFDALPLRYRNGYLSTKKTKVDDEGKVVS